MEIDAINIAIINHLKDGRTSFKKIADSLKLSEGTIRGRFDLILMVMLKKEFGILEFYTEEVSKIEDVRSVETFVVYKSFNLKVPLAV